MTTCAAPTGQVVSLGCPPALVAASGSSPRSIRRAIPSHSWCHRGPWGFERPRVPCKVSHCALPNQFKFCNAKAAMGSSTLPISRNEIWEGAEDEAVPWLVGGAMNSIPSVLEHHASLRRRVAGELTKPIDNRKPCHGHPDCRNECALHKNTGHLHKAAELLFHFISSHLISFYFISFGLLLRVRLVCPLPPS